MSGLSDTARFVSTDPKLRVDWVDKRTWRLVRPLVYDSQVAGASGGRRFRVPVDFETDFASVPRPLRGVAARQTATARAATVHDYLVRHLEVLGITRWEADAVFYEALLAEGVGKLSAWLMYRLGVNVGTIFANHPILGDLLMLGVNRIAKRFMPLLMIALLIAAVLASGGCAPKQASPQVTVNKNVYVYGDKGGRFAQASDLENSDSESVDAPASLVRLPDGASDVQSPGDVSNAANRGYVNVHYQTDSATDLKSSLEAVTELRDVLNPDTDVSGLPGG